MKIIYENALASSEDVRDFVMEGRARITFSDHCMRMENELSPDLQQKANFVFWCPETFPRDVEISWDFRPVREPGLCMLFFAARGRNGEDLFDPALQPRTGEYPLYHHGDIDAFHVSYFRRKEPEERAFHTCNLRKSYGFYLVAQGGDPIPDAEEAADYYRMRVMKKGQLLTFAVNELEIFRYEDDGVTFGPVLGEGKVGFRQLAPMVAEYRNLRVRDLT